MDDLVRHYSGTGEGGRLFASKARNMEFRSTTRIVEARLPPSARILELGAGEGAYALYFAAQGHRITAVDLVPEYVDTIKKRAIEEGLENIEAVQSDARTLKPWSDGSFDAVLCLGPLYHLRLKAERLDCLRECARVLAPGGFAAFAFINLTCGLAYCMQGKMVFNDADYADFLQDDWKKKDHPDAFLNIAHLTTPEKAEEEVLSSGFEILEHAAVDGIYSLIKDRMEDLDEGSMNALLDFHQKTMYLKSSLGASSHTLIIARKAGEKDV